MTHSAIRKGFIARNAKLMKGTAAVRIQVVPHYWEVGSLIRIAYNM